MCWRISSFLVRSRSAVPPTIRWLRGSSATSLAMASADTLMDVMQEAAHSLNSIIAKLDEGEGTAALMLNDPTLYTTADSTMTSLKRLMDEMRRNPKKYFKVNVMDF